MSGTDADPRAEETNDEQERELWTRRQDLIQRYQRKYDCRLIVLLGGIVAESALPLEVILDYADSAEDLHLLLQTPGGDGEAAVRLVRRLQSRCRELTIVIPHEAKSAGTLLALGGHRIIMGPISDLGPVDPQFLIDERDYFPGKSIVAAFRYAERAVETSGDIAAFHAHTLANRSAFLAQLAREAIEHSDLLLRQALAANQDRLPEEVAQLAAALGQALISEPQSHSAVISPSDAHQLGLPVIELDSQHEHWRLIRELWTQYFEVPHSQIYESAEVSLVFDLGEQAEAESHS